MKTLRYWLALLCLLGSVLAANFYPYPFVYGVDAANVTLEHGNLFWHGEQIAWNVVDYNVESNGLISRLVLENSYGYTTVFLDNMSTTFRQIWFPKANNQDDMKLAVSVEQTVNANQMNQVCKATSKGSYYELKAVNSNYDWLIERSLALHDVLFNGAKWVYEGNSAWKIYRVT